MRTERRSSTDVGRKDLPGKHREAKLPGLRFAVRAAADDVAWRRVALAGIPFPDSQPGTAMACSCVEPARPWPVRMGARAVSLAGLHQRQRRISRSTERA